MTTIGAALAAARKSLEAAGLDSPGLDARLLLGAAAGLDTAGLLARGGEALPSLAEARFNAHIVRRVKGEPVARILGEKEFWGLPFLVNAATLVPRPDTETLVETVLAEAGRYGPHLSICDLGTGSGAIVIAILSELPEARGTASDISEEALDAARENAERLGVSARISFHRGDFAHGPEGPFDVVVSNPPYIERDAIAGLEPEVRDHDPVLALDGGPDGLDAMRIIVDRAPAMLNPGGLLALEVGRGQAEAVAALCREAGLAEVGVRRDLAGIGRVVAGFNIGEPKRRRKKPLGNRRISG